MRAVSLDNALGDWNALLDRVVAGRAPVAVTQAGGKGVVLITESEWAAVMEKIGAIPSGAPASPSR